MLFNPDNPVVQLCAKGIETEGTADFEAARALYLQAWSEATNDIEWFTAAHYLARNRTNLHEQLKWNELSLQHALKVDTPEIKSTYASLYLNLGKSYEDLGDMQMAADCYMQAAQNITYLGSDGYGKMIGGGIAAALERVK